MECAQFCSYYKMKQGFGSKAEQHDVFSRQNNVEDLKFDFFRIA